MLLPVQEPKQDGQDIRCYDRKTGQLLSREAKYGEMNLIKEYELEEEPNESSDVIVEISPIISGIADGMHTVQVD